MLGLLRTHLFKFRKHKHSRIRNTYLKMSIYTKEAIFDTTICFFQGDVMVTEL